MDYYKQAVKLVGEMSLEEKASLCSGEDFWHLKAIEQLSLPSVMVTDGPHGLRKQNADADQLGINDSAPATCFPAECATACSFDAELTRKIGKAIGEECREENVAAVLGPGVNIKRSPLCGRNFEYFSEDPLVAGELAAGFIEGVQSQNVGTSLKHYAVNNQETRRMTTESVVDERALFEIYLPAFEAAIKKAQPWTVMCSYNKLRGEYASDSRFLLNDVLRERFGFTGLVVSDWGATNNRVAGVKAGMDLEMPAVSRANDKAIVAAVKNGNLTEEELDLCAARVVEFILKSKARKAMTYDRDAHHKLAREVAAASAVLLKNENNLLPIKKGKTIAVIGAMAEKPRYQGAGSSKINPNRVDSALDELLAAGFGFDYAAGYELSSDRPSEELIHEACEAARDKDYVLIFAGLPDRYESEGFDRKTIDMPSSHTELIRRVFQVNPHIAVVLQCGSVVECEWERYAEAILLSYLGGEATCGAAVDLLTGKLNPSGKLAESWCYKLSDCPSYKYFPGYGRSVEYRESIFVGYRYYDTAKKSVRYPFGYGLSYTSFKYGKTTLSKKKLNDNEELSVTVEVTNEGALDGAETVQLYVAPKNSKLLRPTQELRAFKKVFLKAGETAAVSLTLTPRAFCYFDVNAHEWAAESGDYEIRVGASSRDIKSICTVSVTAKNEASTFDYEKNAPSYLDLSNGVDIKDAEFTALIGAPLPPREKTKREPHTVNSTIAEIQDRFFGRVLAKAMKKKSEQLMGDNEDMKLMVSAMLEEAPLRMLLMTGGDAMSPEKLNGIVEILNGHPIKGFKLMTTK